MYKRINNIIEAFIRVKFKWKYNSINTLKHLWKYKDQIWYQQEYTEGGDDYHACKRKGIIPKSNYKGIKLKVYEQGWINERGL